MCRNIASYVFNQLRQRACKCCFCAFRIPLVCSSAEYCFSAVVLDNNAWPLAPVTLSCCCTVTHSFCTVGKEERLMLWDAKVGHQQFTGAWRGPALLFILFPPNWSCTSESVSPTKMPFCFKCCHTKVFGFCCCCFLRIKQ